MIRMRSRGSTNKTIDHFYVLSREQNFYPNPGQHFFKSRVKVSLPHPLQCLVSGSLREQQKLAERNEFIYESSGSKGISLVCGNFKKLLTIPSRVPIHVFGAGDLKLTRFFSSGEVQGYFDFLLEKFGPLEIKELNLLLRRWHNFGGVSNQGFVVFNLLDSVILDDDLSVVRRLRVDNPVFFTDVNKDNLVHEMAHQWWGGVISWMAYQDQWLTEGLAQFSTLYYLQNTLEENKFRKIIASARKWIFRKNDVGPLVYGKRIANVSDDLAAYQSIIYNKAALVFLMLKEILGEEEMLHRLRGILADFKYQSLATAQFIRHFCQGDERLQKFFSGWVYSRLNPDVQYQIAISGQSAEITFTQKNTDFVFPVGIVITSRAGKVSRTLIVQEKMQKFKITENAPILSIVVDALVSPVDLED
jgi:aminopeptidase N